MASVEKRSKTLAICLRMRDALQRRLKAPLILVPEAMGNRNKRILITQFSYQRSCVT
jgi:hypothetical protein